MVARRGISRSFAILAIGLVGVSAHAEQGAFVRDAMSTIGLIEPERPSITYTERAPLAMPPGLNGQGVKPGKGAHSNKGSARTKAGGIARGTIEGPIEAADQGRLPNLPPPQTRPADPQWPKDPEVAQRERAAIEADKPVVGGAQGRVNDNNMTLSAREIAGGRREGAGLSDAPADRPGETRDATWLNPLQLLVGRTDEEAEPSAVEPDRDGLTDPPTGYRKPPAKVGRLQAAPVGGSISGNEEADPRAYLRNGR